MIHNVRLEHYQFDSSDKEGVSTFFSPFFHCTDIQLLAMELFAACRIQLNDYSSRSDTSKTIAWLAGKEAICAKWMVDESGNKIEPEKFISLLRFRDWLEAFFENAELDLPNEFDYFDNRGGDHPMFQPGGVVGIRIEPKKSE